MAATQTLGRLQRGIDRTRVRGDVDVASLYELTNAYVTTAGRVKKRDGFALQAAGEAVALDPNTRGLFSAAGKLHTFYSVDSVVTMDGVEHHRLPPPPGDPADPSLAAVHFCALYLGGLYVVAEFSDGSIWHYWLRSAVAATWKPSTMYMDGDGVQPTTPNGYYYTPLTLNPPAAWAPSVKRAVGDVVQPTTYTGWKYTVVELAGDNPVSAATEPDWIKSEGALVYEDVDATPPAPKPPTNGGNTPGGDRYGNLPGGLGPKYPGAGVMAPGDNAL